MSPRTRIFSAITLAAALPASALTIAAATAAVSSTSFTIATTAAALPRPPPLPTARDVSAPAVELPCLVDRNGVRREARA